MPTVELAPGLKIPMIGLGTYKLTGQKCEKAVSTALDIGYRHIDTAHLYENHKCIAKAIKGWKRSELFLTSKFMLQMEEGETVTESCVRALDELGTDYLDLFLLHYPDRTRDIRAVLEEMTTLVSSGLVRGIGVSNFTIRHLKDVAPLLPHLVANQVEYHVYLNQKKLRQFCASHGIHIISYRSLGQGALIDDPLLTKIGKKYGKSAAQVSLRFLVQSSIPVIPKATAKKRLIENFDILDFELSAQDFDALNHAQQRRRYCEGAISDFNYE